MFSVGDRVIAISEYDENENIVGVEGTVADVLGDEYGIIFDKDICGHNLRGEADCEYGCGWWVGAGCLQLLHIEPDDERKFAKGGD